MNQAYLNKNHWSQKWSSLSMKSLEKSHFLLTPQTKTGQQRITSLSETRLSMLHVRMQWISQPRDLPGLALRDFRPPPFLSSDIGVIEMSCAKTIPPSMIRLKTIKPSLLTRSRRLMQERAHFCSSKIDSIVCSWQHSIAKTEKQTTALISRTRQRCTNKLPLMNHCLKVAFVSRSVILRWT